MNSRGQRFIIWLLALLLVVALYKGHCSRTKTGPAVAFRSLSSAGLTIRVRGDVRHPGIYRIPDGSTIMTVTNMTITDPVVYRSADMDLGTPVKSGMCLTFHKIEEKKYEISVSYMKAKERILIGVPLDFRIMDESDWDALPGIGRKTAHNIIEYRQHYDDFSSLNDLVKVHGISDGKIEKIKPFFCSR